MTDREQVHPGLTELVFVDSMHERKLRMASAAVSRYARITVR